MRLAIIMLTCGRPALATRCLESIEGEVSPGHDSVTVVVNGGPVSDADALRDVIARRGWTPWASVLARPQNDGFCVANNAALRQVLNRADVPQYCLLLNDDTLVRHGALSILLDALETNPKIAVAGCGLEEPDGHPQTCAFRFPSLASELEGTLRVALASRLLVRRALAIPPTPEARRVDWVPGAAMIVRREVWQRVGLLDERYFLYFDDIDFCLRAHRAGFQCWVLPQSRIVHLRGQTTGLRPETAARQRRPAYWYRSRRYFFEKHYGWWYATAVDAVVIGASVLRRALATVRRHSHPDPPYFLLDTLRYGVLRAPAICRRGSE